MKDTFPTEDEQERLLEARRDYDVTPVGLAQLQRRVELLPQGTEMRANAQFAYDVALMRRRDLLEMFHQQFDTTTEGDETTHQSDDEQRSDEPALSDPMAYRGAVSVDPPGCACTGCVTGQSVPADAFALMAEDGDVQRLGSGDLSVRFSDDERSEMAQKMLDLRTDLNEDSISLLRSLVAATESEE